MSEAELERMLARVGGADLVQWHRRNGQDISTEKYIWHYRKALARGLERQRIIFLDTNYWIRLRDAERGVANGAADLLDALRDLVARRSAICVAHFSTFLELVKQERESLRVTAALCDELSEGVVIAPPNDLAYWQAGEFVTSRLGHRRTFSGGYWSKVGQVLSSELPEMPFPIDDAQKRIVWKAAIDSFWNARFEDILGIFDWDAKAKLNADVDAATIEQVEKRKAEQIALGKTRDQVRATEFEGVIENHYRPLFRRHLKRCNLVESLGWTEADLSAQCDAAVQDAIARFCDRKLEDFLPQAAITTELYCLYERDANRHLSVSDWWDWQHAGAVLPLCDVFLTDRHLANQLVNVLAFDQTFQCRVVASLAEAVGAVTCA